ncbi:MAG: DUF362 domain-containing protein [Dehalococcoidia bacterium]|jgi:hypothetical protein
MREVETVQSSIGEATLDVEGATVAAVRLDPAQSYVDVPELLKEVIDRDDRPAWQAIVERIDYTCLCLDGALKAFCEETDLSEMLRSELAAGKKLLLKPNLVNAVCIDPQEHGRGLGYATCTAWPFVAAVMRWLHDRLDVSYHQMALGEAATSMSAAAAYATRLFGRPVTREAIMEGRVDDSYGGWGFYFVRKYLAESHDPSHQDDPMRGYDDSVAGNYLPPGRAMDRLPVYDLNRIQDVPERGRRVPVPDGANFQSITLHKAVVGGEPSDAADRRDYPGCVLLSLPKMKVHNIALFTNAIKNLGIGLYPMEAASGDEPASTAWLYSSPQLPVPGMKSRLPHQVWTASTDDRTGRPHSVKRTAGINGTMVDIIKAVQTQGVRVLSVVDAIETINIDHSLDAPAIRVPEGFVFAGLDVVALDLLCARYMFNMLPMAEARKLAAEGKAPSEWLQRVPLPTVEGQNIVTAEGYDSPLSRHVLFEYAAGRGIGGQAYHVVGRDMWQSERLASLEGHLGRVEGGRFFELLTDTLYYDQLKLLWDLQTTVLSYAAANDALTGTSYRQHFLNAFDENGDGVIDYEEMGRKGIVDFMLYAAAYGVHLMGSEEHGMLRGFFALRANALRWSDAALNPDGLDFLKEYFESSTALVGLTLSQMELEGADAFVPSMTWGKGKWPSVQMSRFMAIGSMLYGLGFPFMTTVDSIYGIAFQYADKAFNGSTYTGDVETMSDPNSTAAVEYVQAVSSGAKPLPFLLYVPQGFGQVLGKAVPNVEETEDPRRMLRVEFGGGKEVW